MRPRFPHRLLRVAGLVAAGVLVGALLDLPRLLEERVRDRLVREAAARGFALSVGSVRFALPLRVELSDILLVGRGGSAVARRVTLRLRPARHAKDAVRSATLEHAVVSLPGDFVLDFSGATWNVERLDGREVRLAGEGSAGRLALRREGAGVSLELLGVDLGRLLRVRFGGSEPLRAGVASGTLDLRPSGAALAFDLLADVKGARIAALAEGDEEGPRFGAPLDATVAAGGTLEAGSRRVDFSCLRAEASGAVLEAEGAVASGPQDVWAEGKLRVPRVPLAQLLATSGIPLGQDDLGTLAIQLAGAGHLKDPASIRVEQRLSFTPPKVQPPELLALREPFVRTLDGPQGPHEVDLRPESPEFIPFDEVPPLFLRTLLLSEDAGFWGHPGIDLREVPVAFATNWSRGGKARGASTISQQLAKNLFLSRRKSYGRKLQEVALTLLLESALGKRRILEIYLNVIEWGPGVYGLKAAAHHYFSKDPRDLTPREGAFLVALIPAPVRYQTSFRKGELTRRFAVLVDALLAKLRSVDALGEEEYEAARSQTLEFAPSTDF